MHFCGMTWGGELISRTRSSGGTTAAHATAKHVTKVAPCQLRLVCFQPCVHDESNSVYDAARLHGPSLRKQLSEKSSSCVLGTVLTALRGLAPSILQHPLWVAL